MFPLFSARRSGNDWDGHWKPASEFCNICSNHIKYIALLEEEPLELWYLTEILGIWEDRAVFLNRENRSERRETEMNEVWDYIERLTTDKRQFLERTFDLDFRMSGYSRHRPTNWTTWRQGYGILLYFARVGKFILFLVNWNSLLLFVNQSRLSSVCSL